MLNYDAIVSRLRKSCPLFEMRVFGSAEFDDALTAIEEGKGTVEVPSAFVHSLGIEAGDNTLLNSLKQEVQEAFTVTVILDNKLRDGRTSASKFPIALAQLNKALLNWQALPERTFNPITFKGGELLAADRARAVHAFTYGITYHLGADDGYEEPFDDFEQIDMTDPDLPNHPPQRVVLDQG